MALEVEGLNYITPVLVFLFVFVVMYAILAKIKILGENKFIHLLVSFIIAIIFVVFSSAREYVIQLTPWFAVALLLLFFVLVLIGFSTKKMDALMTPTLAGVFITLLVIIAIVVFFKVLGYGFIDTIQEIQGFFVDYPKIMGAILLIIFGGLAAWVVAKN